MASDDGARAQGPTGPEAIADPARVDAVLDTGLSAATDAGMERFARLVADLLQVPIALVSLVEAQRQFFPGMVGLDDPWAADRQMPLTHSLCRHVVADAEPLVLDDARTDSRTQSSPALAELGVVAYAGMPLTDIDGNVLGSLCAIDTERRAWSPHELRVLEDLAAACSSELRLRAVSRQREQAREQADSHAQRLRKALGRSELLLRAADALADTTGLLEVRRQVRDLVSSDLKPVYVGLALTEADGWMRRVADPAIGISLESEFERFRITDAWPMARAALTNRTIVITDLADMERAYAPEALAAFADMGLSCAVSVPLPGTTAPLGTLSLGWDHPHEIDVVEHAVLKTLAGYTARAVERALFVDSRVLVAEQMQAAMLTDLPTVPGLELAGLYRSAATQELVGGDWYDAYTLPGPADGGEDSLTAATLAISIGDITGHDMHAATLMGQARSMLRQADMDHPGQGPGEVVSAFEHANAGLRTGISGTLVHAHLRPFSGPGQGCWEMVWTNAGHPPPLLADPDGSVASLTEYGILLFPGLNQRTRTEHRRILPPGSVLLFYTDGLVEQRRGRPLYDAIDEAGRVLAAHRSRPLPVLMDAVVDQLVGLQPKDDVAILALRVPR